jgi:hypothetical protein
MQPPAFIKDLADAGTLICACSVYHSFILISFRNFFGLALKFISSPQT